MPLSRFHVYENISFESEFSFLIAKINFVILSLGILILLNYSFRPCKIFLAYFVDHIHA